MRVNFVLNKQRLEESGQHEELDRLVNLAWDQGITECRRYAWVWPVFCVLRDKLENVRLSPYFDKDAINIVTGNTLREVGLFAPNDFFTVVIRADYRPFTSAHLEVVQNRENESKRAFYIPHLPQPGLIARHHTRNQVVTVGYSGEMPNLGIRPQELKNKLSTLGMRFLSKELGDWHDLSDVDILVGIRSLDKKRHHHKPPTKLFNAWHANIPFIGGYDSAYQQCGSPGINYLRVSNPVELYSVFDQLKKEQEFYNTLVEHGRKARMDYTVDAIAEKWIYFLEEDVMPVYHNWNKNMSFRRSSSLLCNSRYLINEKTALNFFSRALFKIKRDN